MNKKENIKSEEKKDQEMFNNVTNKSKVENQNQTHNVREEGLGRVGKRR